MIPASLKIQTVNPRLAKVTILEERAPDTDQKTLEGVPAPVEQPRELFTFYCDPLQLASHALDMGGRGERTTVQLDE